MNNYAASKQLMMAALFLLLSLFIKGQIWSPPQPFTSGESDKANINIMYIGNDDFFAVWEQSTDTLSTALFVQQISGSAHDPELLISEPYVHFKNPVMCNLGYDVDTSFIFFQKVTEDHSEIYYIKFAIDGFYTEPTLLSVGGTYNTLIASPGNAWYNYNYVAWNSDNHLLVAEISDHEGIFYPSEPDTVFSGELMDTRFREDELYWITHDADSADIMMSFFHNQNGWTEPLKLFTAKEIDALRGANFSHDDKMLSFSFSNDSTWHISNLYYASDTTTFYTLEITNPKPYDFGAISGRDIVDKYWWGHYWAYIEDTLGSREVFINSNEVSQKFIRLSYLETTCRNPVFFQTKFEPHGYWVYLFFESFVDENWQLYKSEAFFAYGAIDENQTIAEVSVFPNPAKDFIRIYNENSSKITIEIFDMTGKRVYQDSFDQIENKIKTGNWRRGIYFLRISVDEKNITRKVILN